MMTPRFTPILLLLAAGVSLAACNKSTTDAQADAVRETSNAAAASIDQEAAMVEDKGEAMGKAAEANADETADAMRNKADAIKTEAETKADAIEAGTLGATTSTGDTTTTTVPTKK
jgi:hypothetical protein